MTQKPRIPERDTATSFRIDRELWFQVRKAALDRHEPASEFMTRALRAELDKCQKEGKP